MAKNTSNSKPKPNNSKTSTNVPFHQHHYFRTIVASFFGFLALNLIIASILVYWLSSTITNTDKFTNTVAPLINQPAVQNFVSDKVTEQILDNKDIPLQDVATEILGPQAVATKTPEQLKSELSAVIDQSVQQIVGSPTFAAQWTSTISSAHQQFTNSFEHPGADITLDLHPVVVGVLNELSKTKLAPIKDKLKIKDDAGKLTIKANDGSPDSQEKTNKIRDMYLKLKKAAPVLIAVALIFTVLSVMISVNHLKTLRRITFTTGLFTGFWAIVLKIPSFIDIKGNKDVNGDFIKAVIGTLTAGLEKMLIIISVTCLVIAIGSKIYSVAKARSGKPSQSLKNFR